MDRSTLPERMMIPCANAAKISGVKDMKLEVRMSLLKKSGCRATFTIRRTTRIASPIVEGFRSARLTLAAKPPPSLSVIADPLRER